MWEKHAFAGAQDMHATGKSGALGTLVIALLVDEDERGGGRRSEESYRDERATTPYRRASRGRCEDSNAAENQGKGREAGEQT